MIQFFGASISPNPVDAGKTYKISVDVDDVFSVFTDISGNLICDTDGKTIYVSVDETLKLMKDTAGNPIRDTTGETIELEL
ncbi:hypothetical protein [Blautia sp. MSJ-19]|uniref:hypothetical protein n=1 Tax=Blautia sp. MSJ-19 TaxID=2841517 RepID=UPI001C0EADF4|nr:hypothetical protein [Blautia sp. MSJ-19]MBU5480878.1 hypothetical protein [Blautia sp. MSJ-19]